MTDLVADKPRRLIYKIRAQTQHSVLALEPAKLLKLDIPLDTSNIIFSKFTGKLVKILVEQVNLKSWNGVGSTVATFDGINFKLNINQPYGQQNDYTNPYSIRPNNSILFLGRGELLQAINTGGVVDNTDFTYRSASEEEYSVINLDGTPLSIQLCNWDGTPFTTGLDAGFIDVNSRWDIVLRIEVL
jgi:hypothetical protein